MTKKNVTLAHIFSDYESFHRTRINKICHYIGIPILMVSILGLLARVGPKGTEGPEGDAWFRLDGGTVFLLLSAFWYFAKDRKIAGAFLICAYGSYFVGRAISLPGLWMLFVAGWVFQLAGHFIWEKKSPALMKNLEHFLAGPIWVFCKLMGYRPPGA